MDGGGAAATRVASVYVHAPFCARRCVYCDFAVTVRAEGGLRAWATALAAELRLIAEEGTFALEPTLKTLYVGGGTPSLLGPDAMAELARVIGAERLRGPEIEWTAEANPESFDAPLAAAWREAGVNRLSLGVQTFHVPALRWMGRLHGVEGALEAVRCARSAGFGNLSLDLIFGLPASLDRSWEADLDTALSLDVPHVSLYGLGIEPATALGRAVAEGRELPVDDSRYAEEFLVAAERLAAAGYEHYEVSNFARPGFASRHNRVYWDGRPYLGLGNGSHSYAHPLRRWNVRDWPAYEARVTAGLPAEESREIIDDEALDLERGWLGLRTSEGVPEPPGGTERAALVHQWAREGWAVTADGRVRLTPRGWLLLDRLAVDWSS